MASQKRRSEVGSFGVRASWDFGGVIPYAKWTVDKERENGERLVTAGLELESVDHLGADVRGTLVVGHVRSIEELTGFKKPIRWCQVEVGAAHGHPDTPGVRGIICGVADPMTRGTGRSSSTGRTGRNLATCTSNRGLDVRSLQVRRLQVRTVPARALTATGEQTPQPCQQQQPADLVQPSHGALSADAQDNGTRLTRLTRLTRR